MKWNRMKYRKDEENVEKRRMPGPESSMALTSFRHVILSDAFLFFKMTKCALKSGCKVEVIPTMMRMI
jgi:hypothetical protein